MPLRSQGLPKAGRVAGQTGEGGGQGETPTSQRSLASHEPRALPQLVGHSQTRAGSTVQGEPLVGITSGQTHGLFVVLQPALVHADTVRPHLPG